MSERPQPDLPLERRQPDVPLRALLPNAITMLALCAGATGVRFAISGEFEKAVTAITVAAMLDGIDGRVARLLRGTSRFGAELDSLSDVTAFGIAPALVLYLWALHMLGPIGWIAALSIAVCCALRLARFNTAIDNEDLPKKRLGFTTGVPAPAGAGMALSPMLFDFATDGLLSANPEAKAIISAVVVVVTALLMVSALPVWGFKSVHVPRGARVFVLMGVGLFAAALAQRPWMTLFAVVVAYAASIPFAVSRYSRLRRAELAEAAMPQAAEGDPPPAAAAE